MREGLTINSKLVLFLFAITLIVAVALLSQGNKSQVKYRLSGSGISLRVSAIRSTTVLKSKPCEIPTEEVLPSFDGTPSLAEGDLFDREINLARKKHHAHRPRERQ